MSKDAAQREFNSSCHIQENLLWLPKTIWLDTLLFTILLTSWFRLQSTVYHLCLWDRREIELSPSNKKQLQRWQSTSVFTLFDFIRHQFYKRTKSAIEVVQFVWLTPQTKINDALWPIWPPTLEVARFLLWAIKPYIWLIATTLTNHVNDNANIASSSFLQRNQRFEDLLLCSQKRITKSVKCPPKEENTDRTVNKNNDNNKEHFNYNHILKWRRYNGYNFPDVLQLVSLFSMSRNCFFLALRSFAVFLMTLIKTFPRIPWA